MGVGGRRAGPPAVEEVAAEAAFADTARRIAAPPRDAVVFAGVSPGRAAACARAVRDKDHRGAKVAGEHVLAAPFLGVGEGRRIGTGTPTRARDSRTKGFAAAFRTRHGGAPGPWAAEAYDAVRFAAHGLTSAGGTARFVGRFGGIGKGAWGRDLIGPSTPKKALQRSRCKAFFARLCWYA